MNEKELIEACKNNDVRAQKLLYETFARKMMSVCLRYADNREMAEDFLQDGFIKVFSSIRSYSYEGSFEGWMRRIFVNTALEALRKNDLLRNGVELNALEPQQEADYSAVEKISADELMELIAQLPPGFRTVFNPPSVKLLLRPSPAARIRPADRTGPPLAPPAPGRSPAAIQSRHPGAGRA